MSAPSAYAKRYSQLRVELKTGPVTVNVRQYRLGDAPRAKDVLWSKFKDYVHAQVKKDPKFTFTLRVNGQDYPRTTYHGMEQWVVRPFTGKGNPECVQMVLQLAALLGEATPGSLQSYCDSYLGLDCNGFVGNYLYYDQADHDWTDEPKKGEYGPNGDMTNFEKLGDAVKDTADMDPHRTYLCLETLNGKVIPGGKTGAGHIVITQAGRFMPQSFVTDSFGGMDLKLAKQRAYGHPAFWAVESTQKKGLTQSWYAFPNNKDPGGVHRIFRGCKGQWLDFKVVDIGILI